ncbi:MAG: hypothetical protein ACOYNO_06745 [Saprospiraceae bacterium]
MHRKPDITTDLIRAWLTEENGQEPNTDAIGHTEDALLAFAEAHALEPAPGLRDRILGNIAQLIKQQQAAPVIDMQHPPLLTPESNWLSWQNATAHILPPDDLENIHLHPIRNDETADIFVAFVREFVPEEVHHDVLESFVLLEGSCECVIKDENGHTRSVHMREGDYIAFALGEVHDVFITSADRPAKAILQWLKVAA